MEQVVIEKYLSEVPYEARAAVMGLNNDLRWAVYTALVLGGRKYFSEIKGEFKANPNTIGPVLKDLVDSGLVAKKIAKFEDFTDKRKVFYEPTCLGLRLFRVLDDVVIPEGRGLRGSPVGVGAAPAVGTETGRDTQTTEGCVGQLEITTSGSVAEPGIRWKRVGQPRMIASKNASKACRPREATREIRNRTLRRNRAK